jgi:hypothetical protein
MKFILIFKLLDEGIKETIACIERLLLPNDSLNTGASNGSGSNTLTASITAYSDTKSNQILLSINTM